MVKKSLLTILLPFFLGILMVFLPLLRDFHFESAFIAALIGCFWATISSSTKKECNSDIFSAVKILGSIFIVGLPPFIYSLITGCLSFDGIGFWVLLPAPSVFLGYSIGRLYRTFKLPWPLLFSILTLIICGFGVWLIEFFNLPQVYFFNHIWGSWPGPIYDETLRITESLIFFRWITFLWIILLWILPNWSDSIQNKLITTFSLICLLFSYFNLDEMGIITPRDTLKKELTLHIQTEHFELFFDKDNFSNREAEYWAERHEFHFRQIIDALEIKWPEGRKIESFVYANAWQKKKLVGAKFTSYVPIWLEQDQLHIAKQQLEGVLKHELVHAISKQFGNDLFNGSWSIGLIEGVAEAIAKDASSQSTLDQILASEKNYPSADELKRALSTSGFYSSASSISYTTAGSFIQFLLQNYSVRNLKEAYPKAIFDEAYPKSFEEMVSKWHDHLDSIHIDSVDQQVSEFIFSRRSLFQKTCPHAFSQKAELWDRYNFHISNQDSVKALDIIDELYKIDSSNKLVKRDWIRQQLLHQKYATALYAFDDSDSLLTLQLLHADALFLSSDVKSAKEKLDTIEPNLENSTSRNFKYSFASRSDSLQWFWFLSARYNQRFPDSLDFKKLSYPNQIIIISKMLEQQPDATTISLFSSILLENNLETDWFDIYERMIEQLVFSKEFELAESWIRALEEKELRLRYRERLQELIEWNYFVQQYSLQL